MRHRPERHPLQQLVLAFIGALTLAACGILSGLPQCWSLATAFLELNLRGDERARPWLTHPALDHLTMVAPDD